MTALDPPTTARADVSAAAAADGELHPHKHELLVTFYRIAWDEMVWRRNAGYRTVILGFGYCGLLVAVVAFNREMAGGVRACLAAVVALATLFGAGYLASNYRKYMLALGRMVRIEEYVGALAPDFLGRLGPLMPPERRDAPDVPLARDVVCLWSVIAFTVGGLLTALAVLLV